MYVLEQISSEVSSELKQLSPLQAPAIAWEKGNNLADLSTAFAFQAAKIYQKSPVAIAQFLAKKLSERTNWLTFLPHERGFLNCNWQPEGIYQVLKQASEMGPEYGKRPKEPERKANIEFCSANPTGPIHLGNARGAAIGSVLANLLETLGWQVTREYYFDDYGTQVDAFVLSLEARYFQALGKPCQFPENGYQGQYVRDIANEVVQLQGRAILNKDSASRAAFFREYGLGKMLEQHRKTTSRLGIDYDAWFSQSSLDRDGWLVKVMQALEKRGVLFRKDGAVWFRSTQFGDDKDRVVIRSNGEPTYLAWDMAYHLNKRARGAKLLIDVWGPDHHGYVPRVKAFFQALGYEEADLQLLIYQMVHLFDKGAEVSMSRRSGDFVTLDEVLDAVGKDATLFLLVDRSLDSNMDFDLDLARQNSLSNPVYYVQYAYTRALALEREAAVREIEIPPPDPELCRIYTSSERKLVTMIAMMPEEILRAALTFSPMRIANYAKDLAGQFHAFYHDERVLGANPPYQAARLVLVRAVRIVLANTLAILGLSAPEHM
jgi:arginyl-tRNA synthetase